MPQTMLLSRPSSRIVRDPRLLALEALFRVIIACYCGHLIGRVYAGGYDRYIQKHSPPEQFNFLRVSLKILVPSALMLGYWTSIELAMIMKYRWKLLDLVLDSRSDYVLLWLRHGTTSFVVTSARNVIIWYSQLDQTGIQMKWMS
ncbi:hypothetical protein OPQ81_010271 [Rhizoctonia solani]|nr:hypothetical protein OPQ81_010271 [Rhizoctonia solani]